MCQPHPGDWSTGGFFTDAAKIGLAYVDSEITISALSVVVTGAVASSTIDVGLYAFTGAGKPGALIASGTASSASTGVKDIVLGSPVTLAPGIYFVMLHSNSSSVTMAAVTANSVGGDLDTMLMLSDGWLRTNQPSEGAMYSIQDTNLPGGSYSVGMSLVGLTLSTANASVATQVLRVALKKN